MVDFKKLLSQQERTMSDEQKQEPKTFSLRDKTDIAAKRAEQAKTLPEGFAPPPPPEYAPNLEYDRFKDGVMCYFVRTREVTVEGDPRKVHTLADKDGEEFEVWGTAALDAQLYNADNGQQLYLRYDGKKAMGKRSIHEWVVGFRK